MRFLLQVHVHALLSVFVGIRFKLSLRCFSVNGRCINVH